MELICPGWDLEFEPPVCEHESLTPLHSEDCCTELNRTSSIGQTIPALWNPLKTFSTVTKLSHHDVHLGLRILALTFNCWQIPGHNPGPRTF